MFQKWPHSDYVGRVVSSSNLRSAGPMRSDSSAFYCFRIRGKILRPAHHLNKVILRFVAYLNKIQLAVFFICRSALHVDYSAELYWSHLTHALHRSGRGQWKRETEGNAIHVPERWANSERVQLHVQPDTNW